MKLPSWLWRICRTKWTKRFLIASPLLLTAAIVAFYGIANWYGERAIQEETAAMKAAGWPVTLEEALGPRPNPEEDLFQHPAILREFSLPEKERLQALSNMADCGTIKGISRRPIGWESMPVLGKMSDVRSLAEPARPGDPEEQVAKDLLNLIESQSQRFDEMKAAFRRPGVNWNKDAGFFGGSFQLYRLFFFVQYRARLRLAAGETELAFEDVETAAELAGIMMQHAPCYPSFISAGYMEMHWGQVVWEGIKRQAWNEARLAQLQHRLGGFDRAHNFRRMVREELAYALNKKWKSYVSAHKPKWKQVGEEVWEGVRKRDYGKFKEAWIFSWAIVRPEGLAHLEVRDQFAALRAAADWVVKTPAKRTSAEFNRERPWPKRWAPLSPHYFHAVESYFETEARHALLVTGIALERYRLKHGATPQTLEALVPEFLSEVPKDIYDGQPLRYQVLPDGASHVWSIWPSGKDEGGMPNRNRTRNTVWTTGQIPGLTETIYNAK